MVIGNFNCKLSIEDCFSINEYLVRGTPCLFKKSFVLYNADIKDFDIRIEINRGKITTTLKSDKILSEKEINISKSKDLRDILGLYVFKFTHKKENYIIRINLVTKYDRNYFSSIDEYLTTQLDLLKYKSSIGNHQELLDYISFFNTENIYSQCCMCYILDSLKDTTLFEQAKADFLESLILSDLKLQPFREEIRNKLNVESFIKTILNKNPNLHSVRYALLVLYLVVADGREPYNDLVLSKINENNLYDSISLAFSNLDYLIYATLTDF